MLPPRSRTTAPRRIRVPIFLLSIAPAIRCVSRVSGQTLYYKRYGHVSQTQSPGRVARVLRLRSNCTSLHADDANAGPSSCWGDFAAELVEETRDEGTTGGGNLPLAARAREWPHAGRRTCTREQAKSS